MPDQPATPRPVTGVTGAAAPRPGPQATAAPAFFAGAILVLATAVYTQANLLFWLFGLGVGGAAFAAVHGALALRGLGVERLPPGRSVAGAPLSLGYELHNAGRFGCYSLRIRELGAPELAGLLPWGWTPRVRAGETARVVAAGVAPGRGEHALGRVEVSTTFPLGLFRRRRVFEQADTLRVLPALVPLAPEVVARAAKPRPGPDGVSARASPGVEGDFYGSRGYRPGDPLRTLDWKRSARQGELMVRELATPEPPRVAVLLDLRAGSTRNDADARTNRPWPAERAEAAISLAASLVTRAHAAGFRVGLHVAGARCPSFTPHHALAHRDRLLSALGRIDLGGARSNDPIAGRVLREATAVVSPASPGGAPESPAAELRFTTSPASRAALDRPASAGAAGGRRATAP